eukprot:jgi/Chlat1/7492/Chrsp61S07014
MAGAGGALAPVESDSKAAGSSTTSIRNGVVQGQNERPTSAVKQELSVLYKTLKATIIRNYLPFAFFVAFVIALSWPLPGERLTRPKVAGVHVITFINICVVFFISGLTLRTDELKDAFTRKTILGTLFGFISIVALTPNLAWAVKHLPFSPPELSTGLVIFCLVPTTLGVGVSLVNSAKGNAALAIFLTVGSNVIGVILIPLWLKALLSGDAAGVAKLNISFVDIFVKLLISFLVPTLLGKGLREFSPAALNFQRKYKQELSIISNTNLALLIWQTISSGRTQIVDTKFGNMLVVIVSIMLIHFIYLAFNTAAVILLRIPLLEAISTVIMASQKSAPVAVTVITYITQDVAVQGLLAVPCVIGQLIQIFVGQPMAFYLAGRVARWQQAQKSAAAEAELKKVDDVHAGVEEGVVVVQAIAGTGSQVR